MTKTTRDKLNNAERRGATIQQAGNATMALGASSSGGSGAKFSLGKVSDDEDGGSKTVIPPQVRDFWEDNKTAIVAGGAVLLVILLARRK